MTNTPKPNDPEQVRERMRELGRASGRARRAPRSGGYVAAAKKVVDPERLFEQLQNSPAGAVKLVAILERAGILEPEQAPATDSAPSPAESAFGGFVDLILTAIETGQETQILGFTLTDSQRESVRVRARQSPWAAARGALDVDGLVEVEGVGDAAPDRLSPVPAKAPLLDVRVDRSTWTQTDFGRKRDSEPEQVPAPDILAAFLVAERKELGLEPDDGNDDREIQAPKQGRFERV